MQTYYEYEWDAFYCYPNSHVLINKLNIMDAEQLQTAEREIHRFAWHSFYLPHRMDRWITRT